MTADSYHTKTTRAAARMDRRNAVAMRDTGRRDLFGAPILEPAAPPPGDPPAYVDRDEEALFLIHAAPTARADALPRVYFRPDLPGIPAAGQLDIFGA